MELESKTKDQQWGTYCCIKFNKLTVKGNHMTLERLFYINIVTICFLGGPRKSLLTRCSRIHITIPITKNEAAVAHHISAVNGWRNTQALDPALSIGATMTRLDDAKG